MLLKLVRQILQGVVVADGSTEQIELLLSGLVIELDGQLQIKNRIYAEVSLAWVEKQLIKLRPYSQALQESVLTRNPAHLLRQSALNEAQTWAQERSLSDLDYQFLLQSQQCDRTEVEIKLKTLIRQQKLLLIAVSLGLLVLIVCLKPLSF